MCACMGMQYSKHGHRQYNLLNFPMHPLCAYKKYIECQIMTILSMAPWVEVLVQREPVNVKGYVQPIARVCYNLVWPHTHAHPRKLEGSGHCSIHILCGPP